MSRLGQHQLSQVSGQAGLLALDAYRHDAPLCYSVSIKRFKSKEAESILNRQFSKGLPPNIQRKAYMKLILIDDAASLNDLRVPPSNRLEALSGARAGQHSIRINKQWRICFRWIKGDAYDVEIVDYH